MKRILLILLALFVVTLSAVSANALPQFARPDVDISQVGTWTPSPGWSQLDDNDTADFASSQYTTSETNFTVGLSDVTDPQSSADHILRVSLRKSTGTNVQNATVTLLQGATVVATNQINAVPTTFTTYSYTLSAAEADAITDYSDLRIKVSKNAGAKTACQVAWAELEVPVAGPPDPYDNHVTGDQPNGFTVPAGENWKIDGLVTTPANVIVNGTLTMRAGDTLRFRDVNEANFVGGGMDPIASDVGLWVMGAGVLDVQGAPRVGWNRTGTDPTWQAGDEIRVTPTDAGDYTTFATFTPGSPVPEADPAGHSVPAAEVFNLTRDVAIEGTTAGHSHIFIHSTSPQTIKYAKLQYLGVPVPGKADGGRYALHFHMNDAGSAGSIVEGVVVQNFGRRALVAHASDGITFHDIVVYDGVQQATWWDPDPAGMSGNESNDVTFDHVLAAKVNLSSLGNSRVGVFTLGRGTGNSVIDSVAVGFVGTSKNYNGFDWPEKQGATWTFTNDVAHNNPKNGAQIWQNNEETHDSPGFVAYRNGLWGIIHGTYRTDFTWTANLFENVGSLILQAGSGKFIGPATWRVTGANQIKTDVHTLPFLTPTPFTDITFVGHTGALVLFNDALGSNPALLDFCRSTSNGAPLTSSMFDFTNAKVGTVVRSQQIDGTAWRAEKLVGGSVQVTTIPAFC